MPTGYRNGPNTSLVAATHNMMNLADDLLLNRVAEDPYSMHIDDVLRESQDIVRLALTISSLNQQFKYAESLTLTRNLLEKSFHFYIAVTNTVTVTYSVVQDDAHMTRLNALDGASCQRHGCGQDRGGICVIIIQESTEGGRAVLPGMRFATLEARGALRHNFPRGYRRELWSYISEENLRSDFDYWKRHYLDWRAYLEEASSQELIGSEDLALLKSHYGFLSAIAHFPGSLTDELHGHNAAPSSYNEMTERLVLLYLYSLLGFVFQPLAIRARSLGFWNSNFIDRVEETLIHLELVRAELQFPFASRHPFDSWQSENVRQATELHSLNFHDLNLEHLTDNFLYRLRDLHTGNIELSTGQIWVPHQFL